MTTDETTEIVVADVSPGALIQSDPTAALENTEKLVRYMSDRCTGPKFVSTIQGRMYPKVEWWTTVGMTLGLLPVEVSSKRIDFDGGYKYEAVVEVRRGDMVITRASAICSTDERAWGRRDEYAVKSMAATRATGKAYRIGLSALAVMAGLEATPADEIPPQGFDGRPQRRSAPAGGQYGRCEKHANLGADADYFKAGKMKNPAHKYTDPDTGEVKWCAKPADPPAPDPAWTAAFNRFREALTEAGHTEDGERQDVVRGMTGKTHPRELSADELDAMIEHIPTKED